VLILDEEALISQKNQFSFMLTTHSAFVVGIRSMFFLQSFNAWFKI